MEAGFNSPDDIGRRFEREQRGVLRKREEELSDSLAPFRVGSVPYLNAVPLTRGLESEVILATPSKLAEMLRRDELDAALVSVTEVLFSDRYDILDGVAVASLGEVKSVFLAHRRPVAEAKEIFCDPASLTSVNLLRVLLAEQGIRPQFKPLPSYDHATLPDYALLIGDPALDFLHAPAGRGATPLATDPTPEEAVASGVATLPHEIWDLGAAWFELTGLPFVYAVWALRRGIDYQKLARQLRDAKDFGLDTLDYIITSRSEYDLSFRKDYLGWHIHYHLGPDEKRGLKRFAALLARHGVGKVFEPKYAP